MTSQPAPILEYAPPSARPARLVGYDVARALAILGMVVVHFSLVMAADVTRPGWLGEIVELLDGRAAATFVVLAGVGLSLRWSRVETAEPELGARRAERATIARRGVLLLVVGFLNLAIWPGDILRVYGVSLLLAAWLVSARAGVLWAAAGVFVLGFIALFVGVNYDAHWDWKTMTYHDLWTPAGVVRNLFYDGFRSVFPWTGLLLFGVWLGRRDAHSPGVRRRMLAGGLAAWGVAEGVSWAVLRIQRPRLSATDFETAQALFGTISMPPLPLFLLSAGGFAVAVVAACLMTAAWFPAARPVRALAATGQLALTWYLCHIVVGLGTVEALGLVGRCPLPRAAGTGVAFFLAAILLSVLWCRFFRHGPLEWVMRRVTG